MLPAMSLSTSLAFIDAGEVSGFPSILMPLLVLFFLALMSLYAGFGATVAR